MKKKTVLAGCGNISRQWFEASKNFKDIEFVGLVDLNLDNANTRNKEYNLNALTGTNLQKMLDITNPDIVFDCTVPSAHHDVVICALNHGCDVLGEKPMAESMADAGEMVKAAVNNGKTYAVIQNRRYNRNIISYRNELSSGKAGRLTTLNADFYIGAHFGGFREKMNHVLLIDMSIHSFDQARFISGRDPVSVFACEWNPPGSWYKHGASVICIFEMSDNVMFTYRGSWCAEGMNTSWDCNWRADCERGSVLWDGSEKIIGEIAVGNEGFIREKIKLEVDTAEKLKETGHAGVIREFLDSLKKGRKPQTDCSDNIISLAMVHAAVESAETGKRVLIKSELLNGSCY